MIDDIDKLLEPAFRTGSMEIASVEKRGEAYHGLDKGGNTKMIVSEELYQKIKDWA